jgi:hypothetical protein
MLDVFFQLEHFLVVGRSMRALRLPLLRIPGRVVNNSNPLCSRRLICTRLTALAQLTNRTAEAFCTLHA